MNPIYSHASLKVKRKAEEWEKYDRKGSDSLLLTLKMKKGGYEPRNAVA